MISSSHVYRMWHFWHFHCLHFNLNYRSEDIKSGQPSLFSHPLHLFPTNLPLLSTQQPVKQMFNLPWKLHFDYENVLVSCFTLWRTWAMSHDQQLRNETKDIFKTPRLNFLFDNIYTKNVWGKKKKKKNATWNLTPNILQTICTHCDR